VSSHVVIVEDEERIASLVCKYLSLEGYRYTHLNSGEDAVSKIKEVEADLCIMDVMLPHTDGLTICQQLRQWSDIPIIMLTARVEEVDRLLGFKQGADDYVCKPFSPKELMARIAALLKRSKNEVNKRAKQLSYNQLTMDIDKFEVRFAHKLARLTVNEFNILKVMMQQPEKVFSRKELLYAVKHQELEIYQRTIDTHVKILRKKLATVSNGENFIVSIYGLGYSLKEQQAA